MNSTLLTVALVSTLAIGCGRAAVTARAPSSPPAGAEVAETTPAKAEGSDGAESSAAAAADSNANSNMAKNAAKNVTKSASRAVGDFVVHRFTGSFRDAPLTLTQRIVAREGDVLVIDMTLEEGSSKQTLRVRMDDSEAKRGEVLAVARIEDGREKAATLEAFDEMMAKTALAADQNEEVLGSEELHVDVGGASITAQKTSYRVKLGKNQATLQTIQSESFAWGDLGGEITTASGDVIYRAELVEAGHNDAPKSPAVAKIDEYEDLDE